MSRSRHGFTKIYFTITKNFAIGNLLPVMHHLRAMKILIIIARVLLGLIFVVFGSNAFLHFLPMPPLPEGVAGLYLKAFFESGYVYVIGGMQLINRRFAFARRPLRAARPDDFGGDDL